MDESTLAERLRRLPRDSVCGVEVPVAVGFGARLLGLAFLGRASAGPGLLIPGCSSVHTFGMRFPLTIVFLDERNTALAIHRRISRRQLVSHRGARAVLELTGEEGGEAFGSAP